MTTELIAAPAARADTGTSSSSVEDHILALLHGAGYQPHDPALHREADHVAARGPSGRRRDLTALPTFTIDGPSTKDFDDAISARVEGPNIRVWVHVADVTAFVRPGSQLDADARRRGTSIYLPSCTAPMLPSALSAGVCSLVPGKVRAAVTCEVLLRDGAVQSSVFYRSSIRSDARLTYDHVDAIFLGHAEPGPTYAAALQAARTAASDRTSEEIRNSDRSYVIENGEVVGTVERVATEAHVLIERLMVLANEQVARFLHDRDVPTLYRTHLSEDPERVRRVCARLAALGAVPAAVSLTAAQDAVSTYETAHGPHIGLQRIMQGVRQAAEYERDPVGHAGLQLRHYTHFTSPIRRYADMLVHRALLAELGEEPIDTATSFVALPEIGAHLTERTLAAKRLERRAGSICDVALLAREIVQGRQRKTVMGRVVGMSPAGCFVDLGNGVDALLSASELGGVPDDTLSVWDGRVRLGDALRVRIRSLHIGRGRVTVSLADPTAR